MNVNLERAQLLYQQSRYELAEPELRQALGNRFLNPQVANYLIQAAVLRQNRPVLGRRHADRPVVE